MTAKRLIRSATVALAAAALWGAPVTGAQARYHHGDPPRQAPASQDGSGSQTQESRPQQASPDGNASAEDCFRRYSDRCDRARQNYHDHRDGPPN
jgi:hypothetical protein